MISYGVDIVINTVYFIGGIHSRKPLSASASLHSTKYLLLPYHHQHQSVSVAKRKAVEVCGAIIKSLTSPYLDPDREHNYLIIWADNCGGQNKNYVLFQKLYTAVHSQFVWFDKVTIKYLIAGHSFMAAELHGS